MARFQSDFRFFINVGPSDQHTIRRPSEATYPMLITFAHMER